MFIRSYPSNDNSYELYNDANRELMVVKQKRTRLYSNSSSPTPSVGGRTRRKRRKQTRRNISHKKNTLKK